MDKLGIALAVLAIVALGPLVTIWALNTLFSTGIEYSLATWFASMWLSAFIAGSKTKSK